MNRIIIIFSLINWATIALYSQSIPANNYDELSSTKEQSIFKSVTRGTFSGNTNGFIQIKNCNDTILLDFQMSKSTLRIIEDTSEMYDNSTKTYLTKTTSGKTELMYEIYALANILSIKYNGSTFKVGIIDGACDTPISGLIFNYASEKNTEYLTLFTTKRLELTTTDELMRTKKLNYIEAKKAAKSISILPGATIIVTINKL